MFTDKGQGRASVVHDIVCLLHLKIYGLLVFNCIINRSYNLKYKLRRIGCFKIIFNIFLFKKLLFSKRSCNFDISIANQFSYRKLCLTAKDLTYLRCLTLFKKNIYKFNIFFMMRILNVFMICNQQFRIYTSSFQYQFQKTFIAEHYRLCSSCLLKY